MERFLVVLDGSARAEAALPDAVARARDADAELRLLRVVSTLWRVGRSASVREREREAWLYLGTVAESLQVQGVTVTYRVRRGLSFAIILQEAAQSELLVLSTRAAAILQRISGHALAQKLASRGPIKISLVRPTPKTDAPHGRVRSFDADARAHGPLAPHTLGPRTVPLSRIVGSVDRATDLRADFLPYITRDGEGRYLSIRAAMVCGEALPAIDLYKLADNYYVLDGHHRVAAARSLKQLDIDALVTEYVPVRDTAAGSLFAERYAFEQATGLTRIGAARPGHYPRLRAIIRSYGESVGCSEVREAAARWHFEVYEPVASRLRSAQLGSLFPGERTADLFVHLAEYRAAEEEFLGRSMSWDDALQRFLLRLRGSNHRIGENLSHARRAGRGE